MTAHYDALSREELIARLTLAERTCLMLGWSAAHMQTDREKAAHECWRRWTEAVPESFMTPEAHPELSDDAIWLMAREREAQRNVTLRRIRGEDVG
jgi:hypothetical protein